MAAKVVIAGKYTSRSLGRLLTHHPIHLPFLPKLDIAKQPHHRKYYDYIFHIPNVNIDYIKKGNSPFFMAYNILYVLDWPRVIPTKKRAGLRMSSS